MTAGLSALAGQAAVALINNKGDIGGALDDLGRSASVKGLLTAMVTGGVLGGLNLNPTGLPTSGAGSQGFMTQLGQNLQAAAARAVIGTAINGGSLEDALKDQLKTAFIDTFAAQTAHGIGQTFPVGEASNYLAHALAGCAVGAARSNGGTGCSSGAIGAVVGEAAAISYNAGRDMLTEGLSLGRKKRVTFLQPLCLRLCEIAGTPSNWPGTPRVFEDWVAVRANSAAEHPENSSD